MDTKFPIASVMKDRPSFKTSYGADFRKCRQSASRYFVKSPALRLKQSVALQLPNTTVRRIIHKDLSFHPYMVQLIQELSDSDVENRRRFCKQFRELLIDDEDLQNNLIMTDEAHLYLSGYINKQNFRYWAPDNPRKIHQRPLHSSKVTVWCSVASFGVVGPYFLRTRTVLQQLWRHRVTLTCSKPSWIPRLTASDATVESYGGDRMGSQPVQP
jgi:hypothetical protein